MAVAVPNKTYEQPMLQGCTGINNSVSDELIADTDLADARNIVPARGGGGNLKKRCGIEAKATGTAFPADFNTAIECHSRAFIGGNGKYFIESYTETGIPAGYKTTIYDTAGTELYSDTDVGSPRSMGVASFNSLDIVADGSRQVKTSDGTSWSAIAAWPSNPGPLCPYNNYLFCLVPSASSLRWCELKNQEVWPADHELTFSYGDLRDYPTAIVEHNSLLFLFLWGKLRVIQGYGDLDFAVIAKNETFGCGSQHLTASTPYGLFFYSPKYGLCKTDNGQSFDVPMMRKIPQWLDSIRTLTPKLGTLVWREDHRHLSLYCSTASTTASDLRIDYFPDNDAFFVQGGTAAIANHAVYDHNSSVAEGNFGYIWQTVVDATPTTGKVSLYRENESLYTDLGSGFTSYLLTKRFAQGSPSVEKRARKVILTTSLATAGNITHTAYVDNDTTGVATTVAVGTGVQDTKIGHNAEHHKIQHKFSDSLTTKVEYHRAVENGYFVRED